MKEENTREKANKEPPANGPTEEKAEGTAPIQSEGKGVDESSIEDFEEVEAPPARVPEEEPGKALQRSIGLGLPSDRFRVVLSKGSFPPLSGRQQFIAKLRDKDRVSFRVFEGDEELASQNDFLAELGMAGVALNNDDKAFLELHFNLNIDNILTIRLLDKFGEKEALVILDMARRPKVSIHQDKVTELLDKLDSLEHRVTEIGDRLTDMGGVTSKQDGG